MPGGTPSSPSLLPSDFLFSFLLPASEADFEDKSTGWLLLFSGEDGGLLCSLFTRLPVEDELGDLRRSDAAAAAARLKKAELEAAEAARGNSLGDTPKLGFSILSMENGRAR
jgi:hypothetical protein